MSTVSPDAVAGDQLRAEIELLTSHFTYDPDTGIVRWRVDHGKKMKAGDIAGTTEVGRHVDIIVNGFRTKAHYVAWVLHYGCRPVGEIDHENRRKSDNRIANLRDATRSQNGANKGVQKNNTSGFKGVSFFRQTKRWQAYISDGGARRHLGYFGSAEEAAAAYDAAALVIFGAFACLNFSEAA